MLLPCFGTDYGNTLRPDKEPVSQFRDWKIEILVIKSGGVVKTNKYSE